MTVEIPGETTPASNFAVQVIVGTFLFSLVPRCVRARDARELDGAIWRAELDDCGIPLGRMDHFLG